MKNIKNKSNDQAHRLAENATSPALEISKSTEPLTKDAGSQFGAAPLLDPRFESYPQINSGLLSINAKPQVIEFFAAHPERWNLNGAIKMNSILSRYSDIVNSQQPSQDKNQETRIPANVPPKTQY